MEGTRLFTSWLILVTTWCTQSGEEWKTHSKRQLLIVWQHKMTVGVPILEYMWATALVENTAKMNPAITLSRH